MAYEHELFDYLSNAQIMALQARYQGSRMYVPRKMSENHPIVRLIGMGAAKKLSEEFAGNLFPITRSLLVRARNEAIRSERGWGLPPRVVAHRYGLTARTMRKICQDYDLNNNKQPFGLRRRRLRAELQGLECDDRRAGSTPESTGRGA